MSSFADTREISVKQFFRTTALVCASLFALGSLATVPALAALRHGAIATEADNDAVYGNARNFSSNAEAKRAALQACNALTKGANDCKVRVYFAKNRCAAYAANDKYTNYGFGRTKEEASRKALEGMHGAQTIDALCNSESGD